MRINKQFIEAQRAKALPSKPGGCCGTAASKQFVFPTDSPEPCCGLPNQTINLGIVDDPNMIGSAQLPQYTFNGLDCPVEICVRPNSFYGARNFEIRLYKNGIPNVLNIGLFNCFTFNNGDVFYLYAQVSGGDCEKFDFEILNQTCGIQYPISTIFINGSINCTVCPYWDFSNQLTSDFVISIPYQYTGGNLPTTIRLFCDNVISNFSTNVIAYVNSSPTIGGVSYNLMQFGGSLGDVDILMNPGDYLIIYMEAPDFLCAETYVTFTNITCLSRYLGVINSIIVNKDVC